MNHKEYKPGQVVTVPGFIMQGHWTDEPTWHPRELTGSGYVTICPLTLTFTIPDGFNGIAAEVSSIDRDIAAAAEAYHSTMANLRQRKDALLQLSYSGSDEILDAPAADAAPQTFVDIDDDIPLPIERIFYDSL